MNQARKPHLLDIVLHEPHSQHPDIAQLADEPAEAEIRYRSIIQTLLIQLEGLRDTTIRFINADTEAHESLAFWVLPNLRGEVEKRENDYLFIPEKNAPEMRLRFASPSACLSEAYYFHSTMNPLCPSCGSRWIAAALLQAEKGAPVLGEHYLTVRQQNGCESATPRVSLPGLPIIDSDRAWQQALQQPIGGKLRAIYKSLSR